MPTSAQGMLGNPLIANLSPDQQQSLAQLQQQQAIGQALLSQGLTPVDTSNRQVGGVGYRVSPLEGLAKIVQAAVGNKLATQSMGQQAQLMGQMYGNSFGTNQPAAAAAAPVDPAQTPDAGGIVGGGSGAGVQSYPVAAQGQPSPAQLGAQLTGAAPVARGGPLTLPGKTPQESMQIFATIGPDNYAKLLTSWGAPTDATRMAIAAGISPAQANGDALFKANYVPPNQGAPGTIARDARTGQLLYYSPDIPKGGEPVFNAGGQVVGVKQLDGSLQLIGQAAAAQAGGEGSQLPYATVDAGGNPQPLTNRTAAATGSANASQQPPIPTLPGLTGQSGALSGSSNVPLPGGPLPSGGAMYAAPPMGATAAADAQARGQIDTMQKSYQNLQTVRSGAPAALQDVDNMAKLAQGASPATIGPAAAKFAGLFSANAAEYEKSRDNLVTNLGSQLGINSDAARDLVYGSIPSYGAPKQAVQNGLAALRGQIQTRLLKSDYLSDAYAAGDAKTYNQRDNQFDQNITPAIANIVTMPAGQQRAQALQQAAKDPQIRARLEWAAEHGVLR
ncbi:hypothetical protein [Paraburkholderia fynbosensis]|uniref:Uncharacterized protein n=1 Tax=Paraburkholderia fynbosensis TaxID=1200993 RepID=A0A6J5FKU0_9BURK|nr:hypothetical protein [Paraburkholderia fynbosensis]CAB3782040.1 hypothetical protein LMG27177_01151 [Paraburkholderia fynbosensis]